ncbi:hypothetical protein F4556_004699 [Kitasatospora gansuensis]|uniref:DUF3800 domain-containing protein n=1 Tax=Kitasatospora gansuensis TaxID=258050 RepID=A0A7W7SEV0_9ACTN|nr:DUF3800 domain-containing protein [Kitasatospora gansuensis]MBB4949164.1 hypothetical protein [Kitasatospora gansuensis]
MTITPQPSSVYFVDDSGDSRKLAVLGWVEVDLDSSPSGLDTVLSGWQTFRAELQADPYLNILPSDGLHAVDLAAGRGRPVYGVVRPLGSSAKQPYRDVIRRALVAIDSLVGVRVGSAYRVGEPGDSFGRTKQDLYEALVQHLNDRHAAAGTYASVVFDGNGTESGLRGAHRRLRGPRHIIGGPHLIPARDHDLLQMADLVAYVAFQELTRDERRRFLWDLLTGLIREAEGPLRL